MSAPIEVPAGMVDTQHQDHNYDAPPPPITELTPELGDKLHKRNEVVLSNLMKTNSHSIYFRESEALHAFRDAIGEAGLESALAHPARLVDNFHDTVPLSTYDNYLPFVSRLFAKPCKEEDVKDLLSPGLPYFVALSSATSGREPKYFPKYSHPPGESYEAIMSSANPTPKNGGKNCLMFGLGYREMIDVDGGDGKKTSFPVTLMSSGSIRMQHGMHVSRDPWIRQMRAPNNTSPLAIGYVKEYRTFLLLHALFALADPDLEMLNSLFSTVFCDFARFMEDEWDTLVNAIETGIVPDFEGVEEMKPFLQAKMKVDTDRANTLRAVDRNAHAWMKVIWPKFRLVVGIASGIFAALVPKMRHYLGNDVILRSLGFTTSETFLGTPYDEHDLNLFKIVGQDDIIEYLDVEKPEESASLKAAWELTPGSRYEIILTTRDGFWRYRLGDIVEIAGWDPVDGQPIIRYCERRNVAIRLATEMTSEKQLSEAVVGMEKTLGEVSEFTVIVDDRETPSAYGYMIELSGDLGPAPHLGTKTLLDNLCAVNENFKLTIGWKKILPPTLRVLQPGTFRDYRQWKIKANGGGAGQTKVPVVVWDQATKDWLLERVVYEA